MRRATVGAASVDYGGEGRRSARSSDETAQQQQGQEQQQRGRAFGQRLFSLSAGRRPQTTASPSSPGSSAVSSSSTASQAHGRASLSSAPSSSRGAGRRSTSSAFSRLSLWRKEATADNGTAGSRVPSASAQQHHIRFQTQDQRLSRVPEAHALMMPTIARMLRDLGICQVPSPCGREHRDDENQGRAIQDEDDEPIPLPAVTSTAFEQVLAWCRAHEHDTAVAGGQDAKSTETSQAIEAEYMRAVAPLQDRDKMLFSGLSATCLLDLMTAASFLDMDALYRTVAKVLAHKVAGKKPRQVPGAFGISDQFTLQDKVACVKRFPFLLDGCDDIPELMEVKRALDGEKRGYTATPMGHSTAG